MMAWIAHVIWWIICKFEWPLTLESYTIIRDGVPYMTRYYLFGRDGEESARGWRGRVPFNVFLHCIVASDGPEFHSHPYGRSYSLILRGGYGEARWLAGGTSTRWLGVGDVNALRHDTYHRIELPPHIPVTWTLFVAPRPKYTWWFFDAVTGTFRKASGRTGRRAP